MAKVSIVTPCYNAEKFIGKAIESLIAQTFTDWEYVVVDDGSTDKSKEIIANYLTIEPRMRLIGQPNSGMCIARNNGLKACSLESQYLLFFDADDCLEPQMLEVMVKYLDKYLHVGAAYCDFHNIEEDGKLINTVYSPRLVPSFFGVKSLPYDTPETPLAAIAAGLGGGLDGRCVFRRCIYEKTSGWDENLGRNGGHILDLLLQVALVSEVHFVAEKLHQYRLHSINQLHRTVNFQAQAQKITNKWKDGKWLTQEQKAKVAQVLWFYEKRLMPLFEMQSGTDLMGRGQVGTALRLYLEAGKKYFMSFFPASLK
ncbi:MAG: glycosyltransferase family 2 protein [Nostoc sp. DedQUE12a]|nr:glycosyltransferase family 2 protein [Nostoc sp. DedQUE12a]